MVAAGVAGVNMKDAVKKFLALEKLSFLIFVFSRGSRQRTISEKGRNNAPKGISKTTYYSRFWVLVFILTFFARKCTPDPHPGVVSDCV